MSTPGLSFLIRKMGIPEASSCLSQVVPGAAPGQRQPVLVAGEAELLGPSCVGVRIYEPTAAAGDGQRGA